MPSSTATVALKLETKDFAARANDASTALLGVQLAGGGAAIAFKGLGAAARTGIAEMTLGAVAVERLNAGFGKAAANSGAISGIFGQLSNFATNTALITTAVSGVAEAVNQFNRIPQTLGAMQASGVSTRTIEEFNQMKEAIAGNQEAVEGFVLTAISRLGQFQQAAARSATILKSSTRFDDGGNALRVNARETIENAVSIQNLVNNKLDNAVSSTDALLAQYEVLSGGFTNQAASEQVLESALKLTQISKAGGVAANTAENTKLITKSLQAYSLSAADAGRTGAILNGIVENGITTVQELSNGFGAAGSSASKAGISMSALGAGVAQLTALGQDTSEALTGLKGLSDTIINKTPEAAAELAKLSLNGQRIRFDVAEVQAKGLVQALLDVNKAAGNSPQILAKIFPDAVTSRAVTGLLTGGGVGFKAKFDSINSASAQSLDEVAAVASDTQIVKMEKLANKFGELVITIAQSVAPVVEPGLDALKLIADKFNALPEPIKKALGAWIVAQIQFKAGVAGIQALGKAFLDLAGIYAIGRVIGLAMTGQLGAELVVIKQLIVERKGLGAVMLQAIGINQRHRLGVDAGTAALQNQGAVAKGVYTAQAKAAEIAAQASAKFKSIVAKNTAGAQAAAAEFSTTPSGIKAAESVARAKAKATEVVDAVKNSQTAQNVRGAVSDLGERNPALKTAFDEAKNVAAAGVDKIKAVAQSTTAKIKDLGKEGVAKATQVATAKAEELLDPGKSIRARFNQLVDQDLKANQPELLKKVAELRAKSAKLDSETEFKERLRDSKQKELERKRQNYYDRANRLEEIRPDLSPEAYQKSIEKLNKSGAKIKALDADIQANAPAIAQLQRDRATAARRLLPAENALAAATIASGEKLTPLVNLEGRIAKVDAAAKLAATRAIAAEQYAANLATIAPGTAQAAIAQNRAGLAAITQSSLNARLTRMQAEAAALGQATGATSAGLAAQGLRQVQFGGRLVTASNSGLEKVLFADLGKGITTGFNTLKPLVLAPLATLTTAFGFVTRNAIAAAVALGNLGKTGFVKGIKDFATGGIEGIKSTAQAGIAAFKGGGVRGLAGAAYTGYFDGAAAIGARALPVLPPLLGTAAVALAIPAIIGAVTLRDDFKRGQLAGEFSQSVDETLKKDRELQAKYNNRAAPLAEVKRQSELITDIKQIDPVREKLKQLEATGQITTEQLQQLDGTLTKVGGSSKISADELKKFGAQLQAVTAQEKPKERGIQDTIYDATIGALIATPGALFNAAMGGVDNVSNFVGAAVNLPGKLFTKGLSAIDPRNFLGGIEENRASREADSLLRYIGDEGGLTKLIRATSKASEDSSKAIATYAAAGALDTSNAAKLKNGEKLTASDVEREGLQVTNQIDRNKNIGSDYDSQLKNLNEQLEKTKDPVNRNLILNSINAFTKSKEQLEKNTEALKASKAAFDKYNLETLPGLVLALTESKDPNKAVGIAKEEFENIYQKDGSGKTTALIKDIATLRQDSEKFINAALEKYQIDNAGNAEATAVESLKTARDSQITLPSGENGYRQTISQRLALTDQIVKVQATETERVLAIKAQESDKLRVLVSQSALQERDAQEKGQQIAIDVAQAKLNAKQAEIAEYAQFPKRVVELEQQAASLRIALEQQVADAQKTSRERGFALTQSRYDLQLERLRTLQSQQRIGGVELVKQQSTIEVNKATDALNKLYEERSRLLVQSPEFDLQIAKAEQNLAQSIAQSQTQVFEAQQSLKQRLIALDAAQQAQPLNIANKQIEGVQKLGQIQAEMNNANKDALNSQLEIQNSQLDNASRLAATAVERADIEAKQASLRLSTLGQTQVYERESLVLQVKLSLLSVDRERNQLRIAQIEQQKNIKELELQQLKLNRDKSNSPEIIAQRKELQFQLQTSKLQLDNLNQQGVALELQAVVTKKIAEGKLKQNDAQLANNRQTAVTSSLLADINAKTTRITQANEQQNLIYTAQTNILNARSNILEFQTKQLDHQTKILTTQQSLITAVADSRTGELGILAQITEAEDTKLAIAQRVSTIKLASLDRQLVLERQILELNLQQQQANLAQDKIRNEIGQNEAESGVLGARANLEKLQAKGNLADPTELKRAELDLEAKEKQLGLVQGQGKLIEQQGKLLTYQEQSQRLQLDLTQKSKLQQALLEQNKTLPKEQQAAANNELGQAIYRQEDTQFYQKLIKEQVQNAGDLTLPEFQSYNPRSNINRPSLPDPTTQAVYADYRGTEGEKFGSVDLTPRTFPRLPSLPEIRTGATGGVEQWRLVPIADLRYAQNQQQVPNILSSPAITPPTFQSVDIEQLQANAIARFREFSLNPIRSVRNPVVDTAPQPPQPAPVKPIIINLDMTNNTKIEVADGTETKESMSKAALDSIEQIFRLVKEKY
jgi:hypothetical protein